ncbi:MAG: glycosyltransferase [Gammaproteobacteria bacterium]|nr:glycosyltransferase [Gammaproteobacteria bacterium]
MSKVAFITVVYPGCEKYLPEFVASINDQTYKDFDLVVLNDKCSDIEVIKKHNENSLIEIKTENRTPAEIRAYGLKYVLQNQYSHVILGDSDDWFEDNRVEASLNALSDSDIIVNDLHLAKDRKHIYKKNYLSCRFENNQNIYIDDLLDKNILGLSNTAIKLNNVDYFDIGKEIVAIDWFIFSHLLLDGLRAKFINETATYYRQHDDNIIGLGALTIDSLRKGLSIKKSHYKNLVEVDNRYTALYERYRNIDELLADDHKLFTLLEDLSGKSIKYPLWWEEARVVEEL